MLDTYYLLILQTMETKLLQWERLKLRHSSLKSIRKTAREANERCLGNVSEKLDLELEVIQTLHLLTGSIVAWSMREANALCLLFPPGTHIGKAAAMKAEKHRDLKGRTWQQIKAAAFRFRENVKALENDRCSVKI